MSFPCRKFFTATVLSFTVGLGPATLANPAAGHSVTGQGHVTELTPDGPFTFWESIAVPQSADGSLRGTVTSLIDARVFGFHQVALNSKPVCLVVEGNSAWIGSVITQSTLPEIFPAGDVIITLVRDLGGEGEDIMHGEVFPAGTSCTDKPLLPETIVDSGNLRVR